MVERARIGIGDRGVAGVAAGDLHEAAPGAEKM
jgi:hypothetical protein